MQARALRRSGTRRAGVALLAAIAAGGCSQGQGADFPGAGRVITLELTARLDDGSVVETTEGRQPLVVTLGEGVLPRALERQLGDVAVGDQREIVLEPADAFGELDPELRRPVPIDRIPEDSRSVGKVVIGESPDGVKRPVRVHEIKQDEIVLDLNHPLAGQRIHYGIVVLKAQ